MGTLPSVLAEAVKILLGTAMLQGIHSIVYCTTTNQNKKFYSYTKYGWTDLFLALQSSPQNLFKISSCFPNRSTTSFCFQLFTGRTWPEKPRRAQPSKWHRHRTSKSFWASSLCSESVCFHLPWLGPNSEPSKSLKDGKWWTDATHLTQMWMKTGLWSKEDQRREETCRNTQSPCSW